MTVVTQSLKKIEVGQKGSIAHMMIEKMTVVTQNLTKLEVGLKKKVTYMIMMIDLAQKLKECTKFYKWWVKKKKWQQYIIYSIYSI